jgi:hypothetical protein
VDLDKEKGFHYITVSLYLVPSYPWCSLPFALNFLFFGETMRFKVTSFSVLVLNAKGGEIKAKAIGSTTTCEFQKLLCFELDLIKTLFAAKRSPLIAKLFSSGGEIFLMGKGGFWYLSKSSL